MSVAIPTKTKAKLIISLQHHFIRLCYFVLYLQFKIIMRNVTVVIDFHPSKDGIKRYWFSWH